jgi:hypothetical protein
MVDDGYASVANVDISPVVIKAMRDKTAVRGVPERGREKERVGRVGEHSMSWHTCGHAGRRG